jgi:DNA-binding Lrp family transcriptional regulator
MMKNHLEDLPAAVAEMHNISIKGNVTPQTWFKTILMPTGKPDLQSILILSDIVFWFRPTELRCEKSGAVIGYKKKFSADLLRRSYADLETQFGISKKQCQESLRRLEDLGVIKRVFRTINTPAARLSNIMFISLNVSVLKELTFASDLKPCFEKGSDPMEEILHSYGKDEDPLWRKSSIPMEESIQTYGGIPPHHIKDSYISSNSSSSLSSDPRVESFFSPKTNERDEKNSISEKMLELWSTTLPTKTPSIISKQLRTNLEKALKEQLQGNLKNWQVVCETFSGSKFLMSEAEGVSFKPSLGWLVSPQKDFVSRVFAKEGWTFDDRKTETKPLDFEATESAIEALDEPKISKEVRLFIFQNNPGFYKSYVEKTVICQKGEEVLILSSSGLSRDKIQEQCYHALADFLKQRYQLGLVIKAKEKEASNALKE